MNNENVEIITVPAETVDQETVIPLKEKVAAHFDEAKAEGKTRAKRIQDIFQAAFSDALTEVKGGSSQVWIISKGSVSEVLELEMPLADDEASEPFWKSVLHGLKGKAQVSLKKEYETLPDRFSGVKDRAMEWDGELSEKYGDRYTTLKQKLSQAAAWYRSNVEQAKNTPTSSTPMERKQIEIEVVAAETGAKVAQKEQDLKDQVKDAVKTTLPVDS